MEVDAGALNASEDALRPAGQAVITAMSGSEATTCSVTIVPWLANAQTLERVTALPNLNISVGLNGTLYGNLGAALYASTNGFETSSSLPALPAATVNRLLFTPRGVLMRSADSVYRSVDDLQTWTLCVASLLGRLYHEFDSYYDAATDTVYIYTGEYTTVSSNRHRVTRGVIDSEGSETWTTALEFYSRDEYTSDPVTYALAVRHIHAVIVDQSTGHVYLTTGDGDSESRLMVSEDHGDTWRTLGLGTAKWKGLSIWFTDNFVYWNNDTAEDQAIWRIARANLTNQAVGNDLSEQVVMLNCGTHWYHCWATDPDGNAVVLMGAAAEGEVRDWRGRVFSLRELGDGSVVAQEVSTFESSTPDQYEWSVQLEPMVQSGDFIYCRSRSALPSGCWKMRWRA